MTIVRIICIFSGYTEIFCIDESYRKFKCIRQMLKSCLKTNTMSHFSQINVVFKGQLISERNFGVLKNPKKRIKVLKDFLPSL